MNSPPLSDRAPVDQPKGKRKRSPPPSPSSPPRDHDKTNGHINGGIVVKDKVCTFLLLSSCCLAYRLRPLSLYWACLEQKQKACLNCRRSKVFCVLVHLPTLISDNNPLTSSNALLGQTEMPASDAPLAKRNVASRPEPM